MKLTLGETERTTEDRGISKLVAALRMVEERSVGRRSIALNNSDQRTIVLVTNGWTASRKEQAEAVV